MMNSGIDDDVNYKYNCTLLCRWVNYGIEGMDEIDDTSDDDDYYYDHNMRKDNHTPGFEYRFRRDHGNRVMGRGRNYSWVQRYSTFRGYLLVRLVLSYKINR